MVKEVKTLKSFSQAAEKFEGSHLLCPGCGHGIIIREVLNAVDGPIVLGNSTGCLEVCSAVYPHTSWDVPWIHVGFENGSTAVCGAESMYKALARKGKYTGQRPKFVAFGGDGASYDIGFQFISGCLERGHDMTYICLDNENYANTGGQRSGSTPMGASTSTTPAGKVSFGKKERKKDLPLIMAAHGIPYTAQLAPNKWKDMNKKIKTALDTEGPCFINALSPCPTEWRYHSSLAIEMTDLAVDCLIFPLFEIFHGTELKITYRPRNILPVRDYLGVQKRFAHLFKKENEHIIEALQKDVDTRWEYLQRREEAKV
ncbi:thiamine pyrophosphate-dependent enzyme [Helicobacter suis]|uniref:Pyruvate ferredoxin oxidoreductase, beta subunit PorB n=1 Tax=Helicobacter suis TaxID=104628 RepID=A0A6J4CXV0_9HELI|nr:thiamine pyrophosphate-dependent enzyme [Helicobacter suis]BCD47952.1 Pyruvate ferredoxin oxidoreductase, beta subunit PorB [Helicobacter suis]BCD49710.1 Pyruvate ferredoxin oxidoreductase, beta subunit PorB [Helicobacter suis]BCD51091.1 Pyruvate ferredoxin oxidoreductase, beta subunit PorB [Helicobacter suis]BCD70316.1 Pyruvate ferredoxin oxidoreductase, beta subunit PorB [Helicobacter suis]